jgi:hypothetical protein
MHNARNCNLTVDLAGGPREPRAWKLASVVRGGAVGKGLYSSTSLAAYSTLAARTSISSATALCTLQGREQAYAQDQPKLSQARAEAEAA